MTVLLLGSNGQVGTELIKSLSSFRQFIAFDRTHVDFQNLDQLKQRILEIKPQVIVNAAAYTQVDQAESESELAHLINGEAVNVLAESAANIEATLIHYSTDYVFDGTKIGSYTESDHTAPLNTYGLSKLEGEKAILASGCQYLIFRTSWVYGLAGNNFIKTVLRLAQEKDRLTIINDQFGAPTSASLIAKVTVDILKQLNKGKNDLNGIYHLTPTGETNWFDYATYILHCSENAGHTFNVDLSPIVTEEYPLPAKRPKNSRLDTTKLMTTFGLGCAAPQKLDS